MEDVEEELKKLRYHVKLLGEAINGRDYPITSLVVFMNWDESELDAAHDIFEEADNRLSEGKGVDWGGFERKLRDRFQIGYQTVKDIVLAFHRNHQWTQVCREYAHAYECSEFHEITRPDKWD